MSGPQSEPPIVPQRCLLVLPSTGEFDSRTYRIASTLAGRGHTVTVLARLGPGLPAEAIQPAGYRILRVPVSAIDGLPRLLRPIVAWRRAGRADTDVATVGPAGAALAGVSPDAGVDPPTGDPGTSQGASARGSARASAGVSTGLAGTLRRAVAGTIRLVAIGLTVRSQRIATERVAPPADLIHAMAYMGIPVGLALGRRDRVPVIYDARDIYVDAANVARLPGPARWLVGRIERSWARRAARVVTVNEPYAAVMASRFGVEAPLVVRNCSYRRQPPATPPRRFHERLGLDPGTRVVLYHGGLAPERGIEQLIEAIPAVPNAILVLLGYGPLQAELEQRAADPALAGRLAVLPAVAPTELLDWVASADVVAMPIQPSTLNHRLTTPNKLFEAMAAGVPVVASDLPGMADIVRSTGCGSLVDPTDPAAIAAAIRDVLDAPPEERAAIGRRGLDAHLRTYHWEAQAEHLLAEYGRLTGRPW